MYKFSTLEEAREWCSQHARGALCSFLWEPIMWEKLFPDEKLKCYHVQWTGFGLYL